MKRRTFINACVWGFSGMAPLFSVDRSKAFSESLKKGEEEAGVLVKVLGTAQDGGFPHVGCTCQNCLLARKNPRFSRFISSLAILDLEEHKFFLIDATPDLRAQLFMVFDQFNLERIGTKNYPDAVFLTHAHIGHYTGLMFFGYEAMSTHDLPVYCSTRMKDFLTHNGPWSQLVNLKNIFIQTLSPEKELSVTPKISLKSFPVPHRDEFTDTLGFIVSGKKRKLLYIPDIQSWNTWDHSIIKEAEKVDIALLDGTFFNADELPGRDLSQIGHPFIKTSLNTLQDVAEKGKTEIFFTHLNHTNLALDPDGEAWKEIKDKGFGLAEDRMEFLL